MKGAHVPIRTCLGCGQRRSKGGLLRMVIKDGALTIDEDGRFPGRGAYLCAEKRCINALRNKKGKLSHSLRASIARDVEDAFLKGLLSMQQGEE